MNIVKSFFEKIFNNAGYQIIPNWKMEGYETNQYIKKLFNRMNIDLVIDVGANAGQFRDILRNHVGYTGNIISFEPVPELAQNLALRSANDPNWTVHNMALGSSAGTATFNVMNSTLFSSFQAPQHQEIDLSEYGNNISHQIEVNVTTLDQFFLEEQIYHNQHNIYIKIDTQGHDMEVINGCQLSLKTISVIQVEANVIPIYENSPSYKDIINCLTENKFILSGIYPITDGHFPIMVEFDCFMVRKQLATNNGKLKIGI